MENDQKMRRETFGASDASEKRDASPFAIRLRLLEIALDLVKTTSAEGRLNGDGSFKMSDEKVIIVAEKFNAFVSGKGK
jgi:hypothetical protein